MTKTILMPPGTGDVYWIMTKMESFIEKELGGEIPNVYTLENQPHKGTRSFDFLDRVPFINYEGPVQGSIPGGPWSKFDWLTPNYNNKGTVYDYFFCVNGVIRNGHTLDSNGLEKYKTDWYFDFNESIEENEHVKRYKDELGDYVVGFFSDDGMFGAWLKAMPANIIYEHLKEIYKRTGYKVAITGKDWDATINKKLIEMDNGYCLIDMIGKTTLNQLFALMKASKGTYGFHGGNTMMSVVFQKPTFMIWSKYFKHSEFFKNCLPPDSLNNWYKYDIAENCSMDFVDTFIDMIGK